MSSLEDVLSSGPWPDPEYDLGKATPCGEEHAALTFCFEDYRDEMLVYCYACKRSGRAQISESDRRKPEVVRRLAEEALKEAP